MNSAKRRRQLPGLLFATLLACVALAACARETGYTLQIIRTAGNELIASIPVSTGLEFSLDYTHSVSNTPVTGEFLVTADARIRPTVTRFDAFGPGLPWTPGTEHVTDTDGRIVYTHDDEARDELLLWVSELTRETVRVGETTIQLYAPGGQYERVLIRIEGRSR